MVMEGRKMGRWMWMKGWERLPQRTWLLPLFKRLLECLPLSCCSTLHRRCSWRRLCRLLLCWYRLVRGDRCMVRMLASLPVLPRFLIVLPGKWYVQLLITHSCSNQG